MASSPKISAFLDQARSALNIELPPAAAITVRPSTNSSNQLILDGIRRAFSFPSSDSSSSFTVLLNSDNGPSLLIQTLESFTADLDSADAKFAFDEAIDDMTLAAWHANKTASHPEATQLCFERFKLLYPTPKPIDTDSPAVKAYLQYVSRELQIALPEIAADVFDFGDGIARVTENLNSLAVAGAKTGTMSFPCPRPPHWGPGDYSVGLGQYGEPYLLMLTESFHENQFDKIEEEFALSEGEGTYEEWREGHIWCWREKRDHDGSLFGDGKGKFVLCERFKTLWPKQVEYLKQR